MLFCTRHEKKIFAFILKAKIWIWGLTKRGAMNLRRLVMWTKSLKFSIKASLVRIALTPGWRFSLTPHTAKQMPVTKNRGEAGSAYSAAELGNDLFRLWLERNTSLSNSLISERREDEEQILFGFFVLFLVFFCFVFVRCQACVGSFSVLTVSQAVLCMLLLSPFKNSDVGFKYSAVQPPPLFITCCFSLQICGFFSSSLAAVAFKILFETRF